MVSVRYDWDDDLGAHINVSIGKGHGNDAHVFVEGADDTLEAVLTQIEKLTK